jgi:hypothetical protein
MAVPSMDPLDRSMVASFMVAPFIVDPCMVDLRMFIVDHLW